MPTYTDTVGFNRGSAAHRAQGVNKVSVLEVDLDFVQITADRAAAGLTAFAANDVLEVLPIPAKTLVLNVGVDVTTADGTASTIDIGDGDDVDGYIDGHDANAVGSAATVLALTEAAPNTVTGYSNGKYYAAADTIDITMLTAPQDASVMRVWAVVVDCS